MMMTTFAVILIVLEITGTCITNDDKVNLF